MTAITGVHPYADKFPMLPEAEHVELRESIRANGLRNPIVTDRDGRIVDGRNRYKCCEEIGIEPDVIVYEGDDIAEYVIDCNVTRRNMMVGARAMSMALVMLADGRRADGKWEYGSIRESFATKNSSSLSVALSKAGTVLDFKPDLASEVVHESMSLDQAYEQAVRARDAEKERLAREERLKAEEAEAKAFILDTAPDLAERVDGEDLHSYVEARDIWNRRNREEAERIQREQERERQQKQERERSLTQLYTGMAEALATCANYGKYEDIHALMEDYSRDRLYPPQLETSFDLVELRAVERLAQELITWRNQ